MAKYRIYIGKNKDKKEDRHPDLKVALMITKEDGKIEFIPCGALWKSKTSSGYSGEIDTEAKPYKKEEKVVEESQEISF